MSESGMLTFPEGESLADLATYVGRARQLDAEGAIRLQAAGPVLAAWVCVLPGQGLLGQGVVLGLRTMQLVPREPLDVTVPLAGLSDRFARRASTREIGTSIPVPPTHVRAPWTALTPPRAGWEPVGTVDPAVLLEAARAGIEEVALGAPEGSGSHAVSALRQRVWAREVALLGAGTSTSVSIPAGVGLAVRTLGFAGPDSKEPAAVYHSGGWSRVSMRAGHVLYR